MGILALLTLGALAVGFLLPSTWEARAETVIDAPPEAVFPWVASGAGWRAWTPGPESGVEAFGPDVGPGSGYRWDDPGYGKGEFVLTRADLAGGEIRYRVEVEGGSIVVEGHLLLEAVPALDPDQAAEGVLRTRLRWEEAGDFGWNPLLGYLSGRMESLQGEQLAQSLRALRTRVEGGVAPPPMPGGTADGPADPS